VFSRASDAVAAALDAQLALGSEAWPDDIVLQVRMALHTGEAEERDGNYFGDAVNRTARLMETASGGQVVLSATTAEVVRNQLPQGAELFDHGLQPLRSLAHPERVVEVLFGGRSPRPLTSKGPPATAARVIAPRDLIGRDADVAAVEALLDHCHLVTLTGVGGVGKTSLASEAARRVAGRFADGVWVAELAAVGKAEEVPLALMELLSLRPQVDVSPSEAVLRALTHQDALVLLDNCEHVLDVVAAVAADVRRRCPGVRVLATSREPLGVTGERTFDVRPLAPSDGAALFVTRLAEHHARFGSEASSDLSIVLELCERLDGLPLAIELAAARARSIPVPELLARLGERFRLLRGHRTAAARHHTLRETVAWSYELLTPDERVLFDRLSVFAGGFTLSAAEAVAADDHLDAIDVDDLVASLADKSMIVMEPSGRYRVLETLRQFGEEQLRGAGALDQLRDRHLAYFTRCVEEAHDGLLGPDEAAVWRRLQQDWANVRAAFTWACAHQDVDAAATIATKLTWVATYHDTSEPYAWLVTVAALPGALEGERAADVLAANAWAAWERGQLRRSVDLARQALATERPGRPNVDFYAEFALLSAGFFLGDESLARDYMDKAVARAHASGAGALESIFISAGAILLNGAGRHDEAISVARHARAVADAAGNPSARGWALLQEGASRSAADPEAAVVLFEEALAIAQANELTLVGWGARRDLGRLYGRTGRVAAAAELLAEALATMRRKSAWMFAQQTLIESSELLIHFGDLDGASVLHGATRSTAAAGALPFAARLDGVRDHLASVLGPERFEELASAGELLPIEQAARLGEDKLDELGRAAASPTPTPS
jgi:predicted ATPase